MREILFRGVPTQDWNKHFFADIWKDNCNGNFVYGSLIVSKDKYYICVSALCQINSCINNGTTSMIEVIPETVGEYTGLTDKNGTKIFEGDYWLDTDEDYIVYVVEFRAQFGFACYGWKGVLMPYGFDENAGGWGEIDFAPMTDFNIELIEIEGNIHDNPELLKGGVSE